LQLKGRMSQREIGNLFGISRQAVSDIQRGVTWTYDE
jgi:predicted XRE-type DNA-binding protein